MNIWFDLSNTPHINMFLPIITELRRDHQVIITCRPLANTIEMLELVNLDYVVVGKHYGKNIFAKLYGFPIRVFQLFRFLSSKNIDLAISQSSFHSPLVSFLLGKPSLYMNDNEHAKGNIISFFFATKILVPEFFSLEMVKQQWGNPSKVIQYPGVKEGIYLSTMMLKKAIRVPNQKKAIYIRPEPWTAQYYSGNTDFLDELIVNLKNDYNILIFPRGPEQALHYQSTEFSGVTIQSNPLNLVDIVSNCDLFIGAGGTMTREIAILGIPTFSVYQDDLLKVDEYLIQNKIMEYDRNLSANSVTDFLHMNTNKEPNSELLQKGNMARKLVISELLSLYFEKQRGFND